MRQFVNGWRMGALLDIGVSDHRIRREYALSGPLGSVGDATFLSSAVAPLLAVALALPSPT